MTIRKYQHLFFDLDKTLWDFDRNSKIALKIAFFELLPHYNNEQYTRFENAYLRINEEMWLKYRNQEISKRHLMIERYTQSFDKCQLQGDAEDMNNFYLQTLAQQPNLMNGAAETLAYLKKKGYKMSIISNGFKEVQHIKLRNGGIEDYFEQVFVSEDVQQPKPGRAIFEYALKSTNSRKKESLMIGDDWEADILGANTFGLDAVFYNYNDYKADHSVLKQKNTVTEISKLQDLMRIL